MAAVFRGASEDEHAVAVTKKTVVVVDGLGVGGKEFFTARKGGHHHEQRRFRKMKIREDGVNLAEGVRGVNEDGTAVRSGA